MSKTNDQLQTELEQAQATIQQLKQLLGETPQDIKLTDISTPDDFNAIDYKFIVETSPDFILVVDTNNHIRYVNALAGDLTYEQVIGAHAVDFADPEYREIASASFNKVINGAEHSEYETIAPGPTGEIHWYRTRVSALKQAGQIVGAILVATDITERKQAEEALRQSEALYRSIIDNLPDTVVALVDQDLRYQMVGGPDLELLGYSREETVGQTIIEMLGDEVGSTIEPLYKQVLAGERLEMEVPFADQVYQGIWVPIRNNTGEIISALTSNINITQRKRAEEALAQHATELQNALAEREMLISELETKNAELERFAYAVSHDLKSPLITIGGYLGYLEEDARNGNMERLEKDIAHINKATDQMQTLLDEVLELSRIGRVVNLPEAVHFKEIVQDALDLVQHRLDDTALQIEVAEKLPIVQVDRVRLIEVVQNLIDNAAKFTRDQPNPQIEIGYNEHSNEQIFYVRDNGIGIDKRYHEKVFGLFEKLDPNSIGTGIGLALVKRIIEFHQGRVWVESNTENTGVTFYFTLPENG